MFHSCRTHIHPYSCRISDVHVVSITPDSDSTPPPRRLTTMSTLPRPHIVVTHPYPHPPPPSRQAFRIPRLPARLSLPAVQPTLPQLDKLPALRTSQAGKLSQAGRTWVKALTGHPESLKSGRRLSHSPLRTELWCWWFYSFYSFL